MLPYFRILTNRENVMYSNEALPKPRRKKNVEVPVHKNENPAGSSERIHKTYSANFHSKRYKQKHSEDVADNVKSSTNIGAGDCKVEEKAKISKRVLLEENERLQNENQELFTKINVVEDHLNKKKCKLKEKNSVLQEINEEITKENEALKKTVLELNSDLNQCRTELELCKNCSDCQDLYKILESNKINYDALKETNKELEEDLNMLKNVVYRLNVQLERYQEKLHESNARVTQRDFQIPLPDRIEHSQTISRDNLYVSTENHDHNHTPISWGKVNTHTLAPLLDAYQDTVNEKNYIIENYEIELSEFTAKMKEVIRENESLHGKLNEDAGCSKMLSVEIERTRTELNSAREQNDVLIKKCALKQDQLEQVMKVYEQKVDQINRDYNVLHEQYCKSRTEISMLRERNKSLTETYDDFKQERQQYIPVSVHNSSVNECKRWYEELKQQYENEKEKLLGNIETLNKKIQEFSSGVADLNNEKSELENKLKHAERIIKKAEAKYLDLQHTLNEVQLSRSACRKQLHKAMCFAKDLVGEQESLLKALNQRQQENKAVKKIGSDIASRMVSLKSQLKLVQRDAWHELSSVEQRIQEQNDVIASLKQEHDEEVERLKKLIKEKEQSNNVFQAENSFVPLPSCLLLRNRNLN